ncbi:serine phosphatase RsbU (regulator of sigma subunit) [Catenulispora sp. GP43]|uniref:PP2C family protein-serine/threonine phosphatase n=1 Tax=Catenulispora sp. GP43 TaxID=3156263 RepID=UPI00351355AA
MPRRSRRLLTGAYALIAVAVLVDLLTGPKTTVSPILAAVPVLAAADARSARVPLVAGALAVVAVVLLALGNQDVSAAVHVEAVAAVVAVTLASTAGVILTASRERVLEQVRTVAEAAQRALLRPVPGRIGRLRIGVRYLAAAAEARIGGDLYEVLETPYGTRVLLGDVQGKGLAAVETAADVLGAFRADARIEPDLARLAEHLDSTLAQSRQDERFVTAVLLTVPPAQDLVEVVNCGHPPPLLRRRSGTVIEVEPPAYAPPLGLRALTGVAYRGRTVDLEPGDLLLLYTDGVSEARDADDRFYPLAARLVSFGAEEPDVVLDKLLADVVAYSADGMTDDAALLAARYRT